MSKIISPPAWATLYDLESRLGPATLPAIRRSGRPRSPIPRQDVSLQLTSEETKTLEEMLGLIKKQFAPAKVSRGQIVGFSLRLLASIIDQKGGINETTDWGDLWKKLIEGQNE